MKKKQKGIWNILKIQNHTCATEKPHPEIQQLQKSTFGGDILTRIWFYIKWSCLESVCPESLGKLLWCGKSVQTVVLLFTFPWLAKWVQRHPFGRRKEPVSFVHCSAGIQLAVTGRNLRLETSWQEKNWNIVFWFAVCCWRMLNTLYFSSYICL